MKTTALPAVVVEGRVISDRDKVASSDISGRLVDLGWIGQSMYYL